MKTGMIGVIGLPNAGKSTLVNVLVGEKVGIVSSKPQTTRQRVLGILNLENEQLVFIDAPGRVHSKTGLNRFLQTEFDKTLDESDMLMLVMNLDASKFQNIEGLVSLAKSSNKPCVAVITKEDLPQPERLMKLRQYLKEQAIEAVAVSAKKRPHVARDLILPLLKEKLIETEQALFDEGMYTTQSSKEMVQEIVREKCFEYLHQEVPFGLATKVLEYNEIGQRPEIHCDIVVERESHVKIVVGKAGTGIRRIGTLAREELESILGQKIILKTFVRCAENWTSKPQYLSEFGYVDRF